MIKYESGKSNPSYIVARLAIIFLLFYPPRALSPKGDIGLPAVRPCVRASVCEAAAKTVNANELQFWSQQCISDTPRRIFDFFEKIQNGRLMSKKHAKMSTFWAKCVSRRPTKTATCSYLIFGGMLVPCIVMMHAILDFWKFSKWPTYGIFKNMSKVVYNRL